MPLTDATDLASAASSEGLYVRRNLSPASAAALTGWAKSQGFTNLVPEHELHATIVYSRKPVNLRPMGGNVAASSSGRSVGTLGDKGAVVLHLDAAGLQERWQEAADAGATWDHDGYRPHVTITYDADGMELDRVTPFDGDLVFGPEIHEPLNEHWAEEKGMRKMDATALNSLTMHAMSVALDMPETPDHPNKHPFGGILTRIGKPSDKPPTGSKRPVILSHAAAEKALPSLIGMGIGISTDLKGHDPRRKIGAISAARIEGDAIHVEGFLYASDFPEEVAQIRAQKDLLGFSWEMRNIFVEDLSAAAWTITGCVFTGAAILYKDKAAYTTTTLAAQAEENTMDKEILDTLKTQGDVLMGISTHLQNMAAAAAEERKHAAEAKAAKEKADAEAMQAAAQEDAIGLLKKENQELKDKLASHDTIIADMKAAASRDAQPAERKTLAPQITHLLARSGVTLPEGDKKLSIGEVDTMLASSNLDPMQRMELKNALGKRGLIAA